MDFTLIEKLSEYCDQLIGESTNSTPSKTKKTKKSNKSSEEEELSRNSGNTDTPIENGIKKKKKKKSKGSKEASNINEQHEDNGCIITENEDSLVNSNTKDTKVDISSDDKVLGESAKENVDAACTDALVTDDGFKIVSSIPEDDSDVSDAFESDIGEEGDWPAQNKNLSKLSRESSGKVRTTEDGFKIISDIPLDDSDVSDAFSDDDGENDGTGEELIAQRKQLGSAKTLSKPILQMIDDFGLCEGGLKKKQPEMTHTKPLERKVRKAVYGIKTSKKRKKKKSKGPLNTTTLAAKRKPQADVTVYDYTEKRGSKSKKASKNASKRLKVDNNRPLPNTKEKLEREMKQMRFEIFKLGVDGFEKDQREESRIALAVKLGAKPRKNKHVSYKDLLVIKRNEKVKQKEQREMRKEMGIKEKPKSKVDPKEKKKPRAFTAQLGRYKDGVQFLSKKDIAIINHS